MTLRHPKCCQTSNNSPGSHQIDLTGRALCHPRRWMGGTSQYDRGPLGTHHRQAVGQPEQSAQIPLEPGRGWDADRCEQTDRWILGRPFHPSSTNPLCRMQTGSTQKAFRAPDGSQIEGGCRCGDHRGGRRLRARLACGLQRKRTYSLETCQPSSYSTPMSVSM